MKFIRALVALALLAVFLAGTAHANTSSVNPNVPAQNSPLSSSVLRGNFANAQSDINTIYGILALSSNELLGTINAGNAGPLNLPTCSTGALSWTPGSGFGCNSIGGLTSPITTSLVFTGSHAIDLNTASLPTKQTGTVVQFGSADTVTSRMEGDAFGAAVHYTGQRSDGTNASPTAVQSGDEIVSMNAFGYNGSAYTSSPSASISENAAANWTTTSTSTYVSIKTALPNTTTLSEVARFAQGVTLPATVTGGDMGAGTINAAHFYKSGVELTPGGAGALTLISTQVASNSATIQWTGLVTYDQLHSSIYGIRPATNNVALYMQFGEGATLTWETAGYAWGYLVGAMGATSISFASSASDTQMSLTNGTQMGNAATVPNDYTLSLRNLS